MKQNNITNGDTSIWSPLALMQGADDLECPTKCPGATDPSPLTQAYNFFRFCEFKNCGKCRRMSETNKFNV